MTDHERGMTVADWSDLAEWLRGIADDAPTWSDAVGEAGEQKFADQLQRLAGIADGLATLATQRT